MKHIETPLLARRNFAVVQEKARGPGGAQWSDTSPRFFLRKKFLGQLCFNCGPSQGKFTRPFATSRSRMNGFAWETNESVSDVKLHICHHPGCVHALRKRPSRPGQMGFLVRCPFEPSLFQGEKKWWEASRGGEVVQLFLPLPFWGLCCFALLFWWCCFPLPSLLPPLLPPSLTPSVLL